MNFSIILQINYAAVAISSIAFFILGALWFSLLFGKSWADEVGRHGVVIKEPTAGKLLTNLALNFLKNIVVSIAMACLVQLTGSTTFASGLALGIIVACGFSASAIADVFIWESRSLKLFVIDAMYQMVGVTLVATILSIWR